jgi:L-rhamnose isomerase
MQEDAKLLPFEDVWAKYCEECGVAAGSEWFAEVKKYENEVLSVR